MTLLDLVKDLTATEATERSKLAEMKPSPGSPRDQPKTAETIESAATAQPSTHRPIGEQGSVNADQSEAASECQHIWRHGGRDVSGAGRQCELCLFQPDLRPPKPVPELTARPHGMRGWRFRP